MVTHEQIRFSSNSGVFGVGNNGNCQGGVLMKAILFIMSETDDDENQP